MNTNIFLASLVCTLSLSGCGGGSSSESTMPGGDPETGNTTLTGIFVDSPVQGISYTTSTQSGTTNSDGEFSYLAGEQVTFSIGGALLPAVAAAAQVTPVDIAASSANPAATTTNIARLLQSLDMDGNPDNGISISTSAAASAASIDFDVSVDDFANDAAVINLVANSGSTITSLISAEAANNHLEETLNGGASTNEEPFNFSQANLQSKYLIPVQENFSAGWTAYRFDSANLLSIADIGDQDSILRFGEFPWSVQDDGTFVADYSQLTPPSECFYDLRSVDNELLSVDITCSDFDEEYTGQYHLSKPIAPADLAGRTWSLDRGNTITFGENGSGTITDEGTAQILSYSNSDFQSIDIRYLDSQERSEFVLVQGTVNEGLFIRWDFNSDERFIGIAFLNVSGLVATELANFRRE